MSRPAKTGSSRSPLVNADRDLARPQTEGREALM
jgi:hypothetical protein